MGLSRGEACFQSRQNERSFIHVAPVRSSFYHVLVVVAVVPFIYAFGFFYTFEEFQT